MAVAKVGAGNAEMGGTAAVGRTTVVVGCIATDLMMLEDVVVVC